MFSCNGDASSIRVSLFRVDFADYIAVTDFVETVGSYDVEGAGPIDRWLGRIFAFEALTETT
jgi:hypothetical protein